MFSLVYYLPTVFHFLLFPISPCSPSAAPPLPPPSFLSPSPCHSCVSRARLPMVEAQRRGLEDFLMKYVGTKHPFFHLYSWYYHLYSSCSHYEVCISMKE